MALVFCPDCNEAVTDGWTYEGRGYHPKHLPRPAHRDPPASGSCQWGSGHWAPSLWVTPRDGKAYCLEHLRRIVRVATWHT